MFGDLEWIETRTQMQRVRLNDWLAEVASLVVIELVAGLGAVQRGDHGTVADP